MRICYIVKIWTSFCSYILKYNKKKKKFKLFYTHIHTYVSFQNDADYFFIFLLYSFLVIKYTLEVFEELCQILHVYIEILKMDYLEIDQCYSHK